MDRLVVLFALFTAAFVAACTHIPAGTLYELWNFDMTKADPDHLRAAVRIPQVLRPQPGGVVLTINKSSRDAGDMRHTFVLEEAREPQEMALLANRERHGFIVRAYRLSTTDVARVRELQKAPGSGGTIEISAKACRTAKLPAGAILSSTFLRVDARRGYLTVLDELDLRTALGEINLEKEIPPCAAG